MKELVTVAFNDLAAFDPEGRIRPMAEVTIVVSEPMWWADGDGGASKTRETSQFRFCTEARHLRIFAESLVRQAETLDGIKAAFSEEKEAAK